MAGAKKKNANAKRLNAQRINQAAQRKLNQAMNKLSVGTPSTRMQAQSRSRAAARRVGVTPGSVPRMPRLADTTEGMSFVECALHPLSNMAMKSGGVPDRYSGKTVVVDHKYTFNVLPDKFGNLSAICLPTLPGALYIGSANYPTVGQQPSIVGGFIDVTGNIYNIQGNPSSNASYQGIPFQEYVPSTPITAYPTTAGTLSNYNPYGASRARVISMAWSWKSTGTLLTTSGKAIFTRFPFKLNRTGYVGTVNFPFQTTATVLNKYWTRGTDPAPYTMGDATAYGDYVDLAVIEGGYQVGVKQSSDWPMYEWAPTNVQTTGGGAGAFQGQWWNVASDDRSVLTVPAITGAMEYGYLNALVSTGTPALSTDSTGFAFVDEGFSGLFVNFSGMPSGSTSPPLEVTVVLCVEYEVLPSSVVSKFLKPSAMEDPRALQTVSDAQRLLPSAVPVVQKDNGGFWGTVMHILGAGVKGLAGMGLPVVSQIAAGASSIMGALIPGMA